MAANYRLFKQDIRTYFETLNNNTIERTSNVIVNSYVDNIVNNGRDPLTNVNTLIVNNNLKNNLKEAFTRMFLRSFNSNTYLDISIVSPSLIDFWKNGNLTLTGLVPGTIKTVKATILNPGIPTNVSFNIISDSSDEFLNRLELYFKTHLSTLAGEIVGLIPATPSPIPTKYPFVGYI